VSVAGASLQFDDTNWEESQYVTVSAAQSATTNDVAMVAFSSPAQAIGAELVTVRVTDSTSTGPVPDGGVVVGADGGVVGADAGMTTTSSDGGCSYGGGGAGPSALLGLASLLLRIRRRRDPRPR
jgi:hypothetical protein